MDPFPTIGMLNAATPPPPKSRWRAPAVAVLAVLLVAGGATGIVLADSQTGTTHQPTTDTVDMDAVRRVDVAVVQTLIAATRLDVFDQAGQSRRTVILTRTERNLETATAALEGIDEPALTEPVSEAVASLGDLADVVDSLQACAQREAHEARSDAYRTTGNRSQCVISADEVGVARTAGSAVAALMWHGTIDQEDLSDLSARVRAEASAEAEHEATSTVSAGAQYMTP